MNCPSRSCVSLILSMHLDLSIDWVTDKIYWSDSGFDFIGVLDLKTSIHKILVNISDGNQSHYYSDMVVDPSTRYNYIIVGA